MRTLLTTALIATALTGCAGGVARKQWLLDHEARLVGRRLCV